MPDLSVGICFTVKNTVTVMLVQIIEGNGGVLKTKKETCILRWLCVHTAVGTNLMIF